MFRELFRDKLLEAQNDQYPSCETALMARVDKIIRQSEKDFSSFPPGFNYEELALNVLKNLAFSEVTSGQYHFYAGQLKPLGLQLKEICVQSAYQAKKRGYLEEEDYYDFLGDLSSGIHSVG